MMVFWYDVWDSVNEDKLDSLFFLRLSGQQLRIFTFQVGTSSQHSSLKVSSKLSAIWNADKWKVSLALTDIFNPSQVLWFKRIGWNFSFHARLPNSFLKRRHEIVLITEPFLACRAPKFGRYKEGPCALMGDKEPRDSYSAIKAIGYPPWSPADNWIFSGSMIINLA